MIRVLHSSQRPGLVVLGCFLQQFPKQFPSESIVTSIAMNMKLLPKPIFNPARPLTKVN